MAKDLKPEIKNETDTETKAKTKYDRKMEERKLAKAKSEKQKKLNKLIGIVVAAVLVIAIAVSVAVPVIKKNSALKDVYVKVGSHDLTKLEYDYFYNSTVNNYLTAYASLVPYLGLDTSVDFASQNYSGDMTWKDMFDEMTMNQVKQIKALADAAEADGNFTYDAETEYQSYAAGTEESAAASQLTVKELYKNNFGTYATEENVKPFIQESLLAGAYYEKLLEDNKPTDEEVTAYYQEHQRDYDKVDFRSFEFGTDTLTAESTEDEISKAMGELNTNANAMVDARKNGDDFEELCIQNASEDAKANYEDAETEYCLTEGGRYSGVSAVLGEWLYADERKEGDIAALEDETSQKYYVVEFVKRYFDDTDNENISDTISNQEVSEYTNSLMASYEVTDVKGDMKYLKIAQEAAATAE